MPSWAEPFSSRQATPCLLQVSWGSPPPRGRRPPEKSRAKKQDFALRLDSGTFVCHSCWPWVSCSRRSARAAGPPPVASWPPTPAPQLVRPPLPEPSSQSCPHWADACPLPACAGSTLGTGAPWTRPGSHLYSEVGGWEPMTNTHGSFRERGRSERETGRWGPGQWRACREADGRAWSPAQQLCALVSVSVKWGNSSAHLSASLGRRMT